ncbi:hypothetical protein CK203_000660 [Vitis vinifera]|uniref:Protein spt2 n=1 Tax=Vitis vinifera TaxID=29760 RepID=A0A438KS03_VITVI|nr:hypothetical protein CK203_000660 [Vitis vinifera]
MRYAVDVSSFMMLIFDVFTSEGYPRGEDEVCYGSFFGPSQPVIAQRVIQESKSLLETQHLASLVTNSHHNVKLEENASSSSVAVRSLDSCLMLRKIPEQSLGNKKNSTSTNAGSRPREQGHRPKVINELKVKAQKLKNTRDYSFLLSDDAEFPAPRKEPPPRKAPVPNSESRSVQLPQKSIPPKSKPPLSNTGRQAPSSREERKPVSMNGQIQAKAGSQKLVSASKPNLMSVDSRKQLGTNNGAGPGRPVGPKSLPSKMPVSSAEKKASAPGARSSMSSLHKAPPSKLHPSIPRQNLDQKRQFQDSNKGKMMPKQRVDSSRPQINKPLKQMSSHSTLSDHRPKKKPVRRYSDDEDDDEDGKAINMIRRMFGYNPNKYAGRDDDDDDSDMEANFDDILKEERRSARIAREEDERELRLIEEEEERERLRKLAKKRKLSQR